MSEAEVEEIRRRVKEDAAKLLLMEKEKQLKYEKSRIMSRTIAHAKFKKGTWYSRLEIHNILGGGLRDYLPHSEGKVVCICLRLDLNPMAPTTILVGDAPDVILYSEVLCGQDYSVPTFIRLTTNKWEYVGNYRVSSWTDDPDEVDEYAEKAGRDYVVKVLTLTKDSD